MNFERFHQQRTRLEQLVAKRYAEHGPQRETKLREIEEKGVFGACERDAALRRMSHMTLNEGRSFEAVIGADDSDQVNFLGRGLLAARTVCRLVTDRQPIGTGFLVAPGLLLTNNHVIGGAADAGEFIAEFDYEFDLEDQLRRPIVRFRLDPQRMFVTSDADQGLDFTFVAVSPVSIEGGVPIDRFGWLPMDQRRDKILEGEPTVIVQHPRGDPKRLCLFNAELVDRLETLLHYTTDTEGGASGSPVLNRGWQLIALHHAATVSGKLRRAQPVVVNEGIRVSSIIGALQPANGSPPIATGALAEVLARVTAPEVLADGRPQGPPVAWHTSPERGARRAIEHLPENGAAVNGGRTLERTSIGRRDAGHFEDRDPAHHGYKPGFLGSESFIVPLPGLPDHLLADAARLTGGGGRTELKYTHFSCIGSASRRIPILTAVNIRGSQLQKLGREDRDFEAADRWFYDPRIPSALQLDAPVFDRTDFDFGHMVRREDPVWGDLNTARMANDDTFYMTNCAPQHHDLNTRTWLRLENAALAAARNNRMKLSVFTGPVLSPQDPTVLGVQVPTAFWKIVAYAQGGRLRAHGFLQFQTRLVRDIRVRPEALDELEPVEEYQVAISEIARVTSLEFGPLVPADQLAATPEAAGEAAASGPRRRRLTERLIESLFPSGMEGEEDAESPQDAPAAARGDDPRRLHAQNDRPGVEIQEHRFPDGIRELLLKAQEDIQRLLEAMSPR